MGTTTARGGAGRGLRDRRRLRPRAGAARRGLAAAVARALDPAARAGKAGPRRATLPGRHDRPGRAIPQVTVRGIACRGPAAPAGRRGTPDGTPGRTPDRTPGTTPGATHARTDSPPGGLLAA